MRSQFTDRATDFTYPESSATDLEGYQRAWTWQLTLAEQQDRRRFAQELHDHLAQTLVACRLKLEVTRYQAMSETVREQIHQVAEILGDSLSRVRALVTRISPIVLYEDGLIPAVHGLARDMQHFGLEVTVQGDDRPVNVDANRATIFIHALYELLHNVAAEAQASHAAITLHQMPDRFIAIVAADGMNADLAKTGPNLGLFNSQARLAAAGGSFEIEALNEHDLRATLRIPVEQPASASEMAAPVDRAIAPVDVQPHSSTRHIRVLLADDHASIRQVLRMIIEDQADFELVAEATNGHEATALSKELQPDVVILDINMPELNGIQATKAIRMHAPHTHIIAMTVHDDPMMESSIRSAGAVTMLPKHGSASELCRAIRVALESSVTT